MRIREDLEKKSPYINHLTKYLSDHFEVVNHGLRPRLGVMDIFLSTWKADVFMFNWIENKTGLQGLILWFTVYWLKMNQKKIVWTHHNVHPHKSQSTICKLIMSTVKSKSDKIIFHTKESERYFDQLELKKSLYFFHPLFDRSPMFMEKESEKKTDVLVWGRVRKSKGIDDFLKFMKKKQLFDKYSVRVVGKFEKGTFEEYQATYNHPNLKLEDRFVDEEELNQLHSEAKFVFFPYTGSSVLNSGALISSLPRLTPIIGPRVGAFKELAEEQLIHSYVSMEDLEHYLESYLEDDTLSKKQRIKAFFENYTWSNYAKFLSQNV